MDPPVKMCQHTESSVGAPKQQKTDWADYAAADVLRGPRSLLCPHAGKYFVTRRATSLPRPSWSLKSVCQKFMDVWFFWFAAGWLGLGLASSSSPWHGTGCRSIYLSAFKACCAIDSEGAGCRSLGERKGGDGRRKHIIKSHISGT